MPESWDALYVKCPYYLRDDRKKRITCQGVDSGSELIWDFREHEDFKIQMRVFCQDKYTNCEVCMMLQGIHEEE